MQHTKTLTAYKWYFNEDTNTFTGKEYVVEYHPDAGVERIVSAHAVEKHTNYRIDITAAELVEDLDSRIDDVTDWQERYVSSDAIYTLAKAFITQTAKSYRS